MTNAEIIDKLRILQGAILNPHHRGGEYVDKRFADVCVAAADALEECMKKENALRSLIDGRGDPVSCNVDAILKGEYE